MTSIQDGSSAGSSSSTPAKQLNIAWEDAIRPVTIRQALEARMPHTRADFEIEGHRVRVISVVANVVHIGDSGDDVVRKVRYVLDDGTSMGRITASHRLSDRTHLMEPMPNYIYVFGSLFRLGGKNYLRVDGIRPVMDANEIHFHLLEAMMITLVHRKGSFPPPNDPVELQHPTQSSQPRPTQRENDWRIAASVGEETVIMGHAAPGQSLTSNEPEADDGEDERSSICSSSTYHTAVLADAAESHLISPLSILRINDDVGFQMNPRRDPYSDLSALQRDILLQLFNAAEQHNTQRLRVTAIRDRLKPALWSAIEEISEALDDLVDREVLGTDHEYYWLKGVSWNFEYL